MKNLALVIIILIQFSIIQIFAQTNNFEFKHITVEQGLSHNSVFAILQDNEGYMWFGTQDGLNKYNGYSFTIYRHNPLNNNSLSSSNFGKIYQDSLGIFWLGTYGGGLNKFNPNTNSFIHYKYDENNPYSLKSDRVQFVHEDKYGLLWIGTSGGGLNMFDRSSGKFISFMHDDNDQSSLSHNRAKAIAEDSLGNLWIGTGKGLNLFNRKTGTFKRYMHNPNNPYSISHNHIQTLCIDHNNILWIGGRGGGLNRFDPKTQKFTCFKNNPGNSKSLNDNKVEYIFEDSDNNLWIGTYSGGLNLFNRKTQTFQHFTYNPNNQYSISHNRIEYIYEDRSKILWIATRGGGLNKLDLKKTKFYNYTYNPSNPTTFSNPSIMAIDADSTGNLWIGSDGEGLIKYTPQHTYIQFNKSKKNKTGFSNNRVWSIKVDKSIVWVGTYDEGLFRITCKNANNYKIDNFKYSSTNPESLTGKQVNIVYKDKENNIWIGTKRGLNKLISSPLADNLRFKHYKHENDNTNSLSDNYISSICMDSYGSLWCGTYISGLNQINIETENITRFLFNPIDSTSISDNKILVIYEDSRKNLWIGTEGAGLNKFDRKTQTFKRINQNTETISNVIMSIAEDDFGNLWIGTSGGLLKFNIAKEAYIRKYDMTDGLASNGFNRNACYKGKNNFIYFGNITGLTYFNPEKVKDNPFIPKILITDFKILNVSINNLDSIRYREFRENNKVELNYSDNIFSIEFASADYSATNKNRFKYKLEGFDKEWISANNQNIAIYTNLYPGKYFFHVIGSNNDNVWNNIGAKIEIIVSPPFYLTTTFIVLIVLIIIMLSYFLIRLRFLKINKDKRLLEIKVKKRTEEINIQKEELRRANEEIKENSRLKELFLANTSHEIRTPLNVITGFTNLLMNTKLNKKQQSYIKNINVSNKNLLVLINDILDFSKIEANQLSLEETTFEFREIIKTTLRPLTNKSVERNINLTHKIDSNIPKLINGDPVRLNQILVNLIGNSIKFTSEGGYIDLSINLLNKTNEETNIKFIVKDNGIGIAENKLDKIFESFSQERSDTTRKYGGTGLGLTIVKRLVNLHNGEISVKSTKGIGSVFTFTLKFKNPKNKVENHTVQSVIIDESSKSDFIKILLVEDNTENQILASDTIHMFNEKIDIDIAENGKVAVEILQQNIYNLVIMDIQMPVMNGYDATTYIRTVLETNKNIPILGMSAYSMNKEKEKCLSLGMNDFITKPFNPNVLYSKILKLLGINDIDKEEKNEFIPEILLIKNKYKHINLIFLTKTYKGNFKKVKSILKVYLQNIPNQFSDYKSSFISSDWKKLKIIAHSLKTSFNYLGVKSLHKYFKNVEIMAASENLDKTLYNKIDIIEKEWSDSKEEIKQFLNSEI